MSEPEVLDVEGVAALLQVSRVSVYRMMDREGLPSFVLNTSRRFLRKSVLSWAKTRETSRVQTQAINRAVQLSRENKEAM